LIDIKSKLNVFLHLLQKAGSGVPGQESSLDVAARVKAQQDAAVR
jgi:hypothetical protein